MLVKLGCDIDKAYLQVRPEQCKDKRGKWSKWVIERLNPEQNKVYTELKYMCEMDEVDTSLGCQDNDSDNHLLRALDGCSWVAKDAFEMIKNS